MMLTLIVLLMLIPMLVPMGRTGRMLLQGRREIKALEAAEPKYDEDGHLTHYDPHYTRAREIELGQPKELLTTCDDDGCSICAGTKQLLHPELKIDTPPALNNYQLAKDAEKAEQEAAKALKEAQKEEKRIAEIIKFEEQFSKDYNPSDFRPSLVPKRAKNTLSEEGSVAVIRWVWDGRVYTQRLPQHVLYHQTKDDVTTTTIRKKRNDFGHYVRMVSDNKMTRSEFMSIAKADPTVAVTLNAKYGEYTITQGDNVWRINDPEYHNKYTYDKYYSNY